MIKEEVIVRMRKELYLLMYEIAKEHRDLANRVVGDDKIKESMISIFFSYTCLEAFINAIGRDRLAIDWEKDKRGLVKKWQDVSSALGKKEVFKTTEEPLKSFLELKDLRHEMVVHWKAKSNAPVKTKYGTGEGTINRLNYEAAERACKTVKDMVDKLNSVIDEPPWRP